MRLAFLGQSAYTIGGPPLQLARCPLVNACSCCRHILLRVLQYTRTGYNTYTYTGQGVSVPEIAPVTRIRPHVLCDTREMDQVVDLNVGGVFYTTAVSTLVQAQPSLLADRFSGRLDPLPKDSKGRYFIDRDGVLFRYVLDFLRDGRLSLPESFREKERLRLEAAYYRLDGLTERLREQKPGYITVGYRGTFAFGRDGLSDVNFRKIPRILICGRVALCRDVFGDSLNESRDPDHGDTERYTAR